MGLALSWMGWHNGEDVSDLLIGTKPLAQRLTRLKPLILKSYQSAGEVARVEFEAWFARACELKAIRNDYVHARWGLPFVYETVEPILKMLPMNWKMTPGEQDEPVDVTLDGLAEQVAAIQRLSADFAKLQKKYIAYAGPARVAP